MSLLLFEGAAGTGKTTRLLKEAQSHLETYPVGAEQRVLALTKFHGSRRRLEAKLKGRNGVGPAVDCMTIDSFAWNLAGRWRTLLRCSGVIVDHGDFESVSTAAGLLLRQENIGAWVARRYPLVVVDELQDCKGGEVEIFDGLAAHARFLCAADAFQDLSGARENEAIAWAKATGEAVPLDAPCRTRVAGLLNAAAALRTHNTLNADRSCGFDFIGVPTAPVGGAAASWRIESWNRFGQIAIISPSRPETSPFVAKLVRWISTKSARTRLSSATAGPFSVTWEVGEDSMCGELLDRMNLPDGPDAYVDSRYLAELAQTLGARDVREWLDKQRNIGGRKMIAAREIPDQVRLIVHRRRAFGALGDVRRVAMTVIQAKNREFESVIALWPLRIVQDPEQQRRLLYNAVTRAKGRALVIVEDPQNNRLSERLFIGGTDPA